MLLAALLLGFLTAGCANQVAVSRSDEGTAIYSVGKYRAVLIAPMSNVYKATNQAVDSMGMLRTGEKVSEKSIAVDARTVGDYKVRIRMEPTTDGSTEITIKYGTGSLSQSQHIFWEIRRQLGAKEPLRSNQAIQRIDYVPSK